MSDTNGATPPSDRPTDAKSPFSTPQEWVKLPPDDVWTSRDGIVRVRVVSEPEKEFRLLLDGGTFAKRQPAKAIGQFLMALMTGPDQNARSFKNFDMDLLLTLLDNWDLIDKDGLRRYLTNNIGAILTVPPVDVSDELEEMDE